MTRRLVIAGATLIALALTWSSPSDGQMIYDTRSLPSRSALARLGLERAWFSSVPLQPGLETVLHVSVNDGLAFVQTSQGMLHAFDIESGQLLWSSSLGPGTGEAKDVAVNQDQVYASNGNYLHSLDRATGRLIWSQRLEANPGSSTVATEDLVIVGLENGKVIAYSLVPPEEEAYRREEGPPGGFAWNYQTNGPVTSDPIITQLVVAFGSNGGKLYVTQIEPPNLLHRSQPIGAIRASMGTYGSGPESMLIVPSMNHNLYGINLFTGQQQWVFPTGAPIAAQPLVGGGDFTVTRMVPSPETGPTTTTNSENGTARDSGQTVTVMRPVQETVRIDTTAYVLNEAGYLFAVNPETGESRWTETTVDVLTRQEIEVPRSVQTGAERILALSPTRVYLRTLYGDLAIVDRSSGDLVAGPSTTFGRAGLNLRNYNRATTNDENDRIILASQFGSLICLREQGATQPRPLRDPNTPPFGQIRDESEGQPTATPPRVPQLPPPGFNEPEAEPEPQPQPEPEPPPAEDEEQMRPFDFGFNSVSPRQPSQP